LTDGKLYDYCFEIDSNDVYKCQPTTGDCDTATEWERIGDYTTVQLHVVDYETSVVQGDTLYFYVPERLNGMNLSTVHGQVITAGSAGGTTDIQIARCAVASSGSVCAAENDMLSTKLTIDSGENSSHTAATAAVVNQTYDNVSTNQVLRVDVDATSVTAPKGLIVTLTFLRP
jgi:hypothetical protein